METHYTADEVGALFGMHGRNVSYWIRKGKFKTATKGPGQKWLIAREEVDAIWRQIQGSP